MTRKRKTKQIDRAKHRDYFLVARHFRNAAKDAMELGYWTAAGVLIVHSAIAYSDALCIQKGGVRSTSEDHADTVELLAQHLPVTEGKKQALLHLQRIIEEKTKVSYSGELYEPKQTREMWKKLERFQEWAERILNA